MKITTFLFVLPCLLSSCSLFGTKGVQVTRCEQMEPIDSEIGEAWTGHILGGVVTLVHDSIQEHNSLVLRNRPGQLPEFVSFKVVQNGIGLPLYMDDGSVCIQDWDIDGIVSGKIHNPNIVSGLNAFWYDFSPDTTGAK